MKVLIMISLMCLLGCRTVKTTTKASDEMKRNVELNTVSVKAAQKETNTVTYWPDGKVYQLQNVKEQADQTKLGRLDVKEKQVAKQSEVVKQSEPVRLWVYLGVGAAVLMLGVWVVSSLRGRTSASRSKLPGRGPSTEQS